MKKYQLLLLIFSQLFITLSIYGQSLTEFNSLLSNCGMNLTIPAGFVECPIIDNPNMKYEYAIKYPDKEFEIRYAVQPISYKVYKNDSIKEEMEGQKAFRNTEYMTNLQIVILNLSGGGGSNIREFDAGVVKQEFNADWGATTFIELHSDFGQGYTYCMILAIHKKDLADAYYFYMGNSREDFSANMHPFFHSLQFDQ